MRFSFCVLLSALILIESRPSAADPSNAVLSLDSLSFVANALDDGEQIPTSGIPVRLEAASGNMWAVYIEPADVHLPPVTFDNGERVQWTLLERATGAVTFSENVGEVTITARFLASYVGSPRRVVHSLAFTTRTTTTQRDDLEVSREGVPLEKGSGYVQLVASAADPPGSEHGIPFYVVLSGRFLSGPEGFLTP